MSKEPKIIKAQDCCREIRLGISHYKAGDVVAGWNTITDVFEKWRVIELTYDANNPVLRRES